MNYPEFIYKLQKALQERVGEKAKVCLSMVERLNGTKILLKGNHDFKRRSSETEVRETI